MDIKKRVFLTTKMKNKKIEGFNYVVSYNDTDKFFTFKDKFFKSEKKALEFYNTLSTNLKTIYYL